MGLEEHIETAFFGFGGTSKSIPDLMLEIAVSSEFMDKALVDFNKLRENKDKDKAYYYEGQEILKKMENYRSRLNNRISKLIIAHNKETREYALQKAERQKEEYNISAKNIDVNKSLKKSIDLSQKVQEETKDEVDPKIRKEFDELVNKERTLENNEVNEDEDQPV